MTQRSLILDVVARAATPTIAVFSLYLLFAGHNAPGGGFVGGLVGGAALVLRYVCGGADAVRGLLRARYEALLGAGLLLAGVTGASALLFGGQFLQSGKLELHLPVLHTVKTTSSLPFDIGVYLVVVGVVSGVLVTLGGQDET